MSEELAPRVLVVDPDPAFAELLGEWLGEEGCRVVSGDAAAESAQSRFDLAVVDVASPRRGGLDALKRVASGHPGVPILALSSRFFAGIASAGAVARTLGVAGALPKPVARETLVAAARRLLGAPR